MGRGCRVVSALLILFATLVLTVHAADEAARKHLLLKKLEAIVLPSVEFDEADLKAVFKFLRERSRELDVEGTGVNFVLRCKPETLDRTVTIEATKLPLGEAIRYICEVGELRYRIEPYAVVIFDEGGQKEQMETRVYAVDPSRFAKAAKGKDDRFKQGED